MVKSDPDDYRVYLERGQYRRLSDGKGSGDDFRKALKLAPERPEVYLEVAEAAERESGSDAARQVLEEGLATAPRCRRAVSASSPPSSRGPAAATRRSRRWSWA